MLDRYQAVGDSIAELERAFDEDGFYAARRLLRELELEELFRGRHDREPAVVSVYPGAGGDDAADWAKMLAAMYESYAARKGWRVKVVDDNPRSRTFELRGEYAYGYLKHESGVHRLVRISPFSPKKLRHTSFALVEVLPVLPALDESRIELSERDLKFEFYRSSGPGGQNVNKVETAVRVAHVPTGLSAASQAERSQAQNREQALKLLKAKLFRLMESRQTQEIGELRTKVKPEWGNQIRSYVLNPYQLVKDHRTGAETRGAQAVLGGNLDLFIEAEVEMLSAGPK